MQVGLSADCGGSVGLTCFLSDPELLFAAGARMGKWAEPTYVE
jgi:hypothetical protein